MCSHDSNLIWFSFLDSFWVEKHSIFFLLCFFHHNSSIISYPTHTHTHRIKILPSTQALWLTWKRHVKQQLERLAGTHFYTCCFPIQHICFVKNIFFFICLRATRVTPIAIIDFWEIYICVCVCVYLGCGCFLTHTHTRSFLNCNILIGNLIINCVHIFVHARSATRKTINCRANDWNDWRRRYKLLCTYKYIIFTYASREADVRLRLNCVYTYVQYNLKHYNKT